MGGPDQGGAQPTSQAGEGREFRSSVRARGRGSRAGGARAIRSDHRPGHSEGVIETFKRTYPDYTRWCSRFANACQRRGEIPIGRDGGRVHEIHWNPEGYRYTQCLNLPIQGICADIAMLALAMIDRWLFEAGIDGGPVAWLHDEIVLEVPVAEADRAALLLRRARTEAFLETLPGAPTRGAWSSPPSVEPGPRLRAGF